MVGFPKICPVGKEVRSTKPRIALGRMNSVLVYRVCVVLLAHACRRYRTYAYINTLRYL